MENCSPRDVGGDGCPAGMQICSTNYPRNCSALVIFHNDSEQIHRQPRRERETGSSPQVFVVGETVKPLINAD